MIHLDKYRIVIFVLIFFLFGFQENIEKHIVVYMIGDSTMADKPTEDNPERGWGQMLPKFFDTSIVIENHAKNGRSTRTFLLENRWQPIVDKLKPGDYVIIQFGHNDQSKEKVDRYTPPEDYRKNLIKFVTETLEKKANPVLCTPIVRRRFDDKNQFYDTHGIYPEIVREVAKEYNIPLLDMQRKTEELMIKFGPDSSKSIFLWIEPGKYNSLPEGKQDNTHFSEHGATIMAQIAVEEMLRLNLELVKHLRMKTN